MKHGKLLWSEDECTPGTPGHVTVDDKYQELTGEKFDSKAAVETEDGGDCFYYRMSTGLVVCMAYDGWSIYEGNPP